MKPSIRTCLRYLAAAVVALPMAAHSQDFPSKPIRLIVEYATATGGDLYLRVLMPHISAVLGQPVIMENRVGGGGVVAAESVARATPDGYTLLAAAQNALIIRRFLAKTQSVDVFKDLVPITAVWKSTTMLIVHSAVPVNTLAELITYAKANPGKLSYGTSGFGTSHHFSGEEIQQLTGIKMVHVPYKGGNGSMTAVMTGEIPISIGLAGSAVPAIRSGKVKVLAMVEGKPFSYTPDVPSVSSVIPGFEPPPSWTGFFAPAGLPQAVLRRISSDVAKALSSPELRAKGGEEGFDLVGNTPEQFAAQIKSEYNLIGRITKAANIQPVE